MRRILYSLLSLSALTPALAFAQNFDRVTWLLEGISQSVSMLIPIALGLAVLYFIWGLIGLMRASGDGGAAFEAGKKRLLWGLIALFVIASLWGIVAYMQQVLGTPGGGSVDAPAVNGLNSNNGPSGPGQTTTP